MKITNEEKAVYIVLGVMMLLGAIALYVKDIVQFNNNIKIERHNVKEECSLREYAGFLEEERKIDINSADLYQLTRIPGIGVVMASRIIEYRESCGNINSREDLLKVKGIGSKKSEKILKFVRLSNNE